VLLVIPRTWLHNALRRWTGQPGPLPAWSHVLFVSWAAAHAARTLRRGPHQRHVMRRLQRELDLQAELLG
jgi:hypothetical protein